MRHRYVAEQTLVSASLLSFLHVHVAAGEYCMALTRQQKVRDAAASAALPLHLRPRIRQSCASVDLGGRRIINKQQRAQRGSPDRIFGIDDDESIGRESQTVIQAIINVVIKQTI